MSALATFRHFGREQTTPFVWLLTLGMAALMLCTVAILNGGPLYYPDTSAYLLDAERLFHLHAPYAVRPVFYGLLIWVLRAIFPIGLGAGFGLALFVQALIVAHVIYLTMRAVGAAPTPASLLLLTAALVLFTPISFHVSHMLPDIYIATLTLALFLLTFCSAALRRMEMIYLFLLATVSVSFHLTALPVGAAIVGLASLVKVAGRQRWSRPALAAAPLALGTAAILAFSILVFQRVTLEPNGTPHLLARVLADGPAVDYLRATCPKSGYALCRYLDRFPLTEDAFMWGMMPSVPTADGYQIKAEQGQIVKGTLAMFPAEVAWHAMTNAARQAVTFKAETQVSPAEWTEFLASGLPWAAAFAGTRQASGALEGTALDGINGVHAWVAFVSLLLALGTLPRLVVKGLMLPAMLTVTTLLVLLTNAVACGALGGVFARYQGRIIWLLPFVAVIAVVCLARQARTVAIGELLQHK